MLLCPFRGRAIDELKAGLQTGNLDKGGILTYALLVVGFSLRRGRIHVPDPPDDHRRFPYVEFDIRNDFLAHIQKLPLAYSRQPHRRADGARDERISAVRNALGPGIMYRRIR